MDSLGTVLHVRIRLPCRVIPLVVLAGPVQGREVGVDRPLGRRLRRDVRRAGKRCAHQRHPAEDVRADEDRPCGDHRAEIVTGQQRDFGAAERVQQPHDVAHEVEQPIGREVAVVVRVPARGAPVAALIRRDDVEARLRERRHDVPPAIGQLGKPVQEHSTGSVPLRETGFEEVHPEPVAVRLHARTNAGRQGRPPVGGIAILGHAPDSRSTRGNESVRLEWRLRFSSGTAS